MNVDSLPPDVSARPCFSTSLIIATCFAAAGLAAAPWDVVVARYVAATHGPGDLVKALHLAEVFAHGVGVAAILAAVWAIDRRQRRLTIVPLVGAVAGGLSADFVKLGIARLRPRAIDLSDLDASSWDTFGEWMPLGAGGSDWQSFPSAHTATAFGLAMGLTLLYPHAKWLFFAFAGLAAAQRVAAAAHHPSDVLFGAAVGCAAGGCAAIVAFRWVKARSARATSQGPVASDQVRTAA